MDIENHIFDKIIDCPVCAQKFSTKAVKVNSPRIASRDSDFFINYSVVSPYLYEVWICNHCGYAAMKSDFDKIKNFQKELVIKKITTKWRSRVYPEIFTEKIAIERYKLALINSIEIERPKSTQGMLLLKIAWMYRILKDEKSELSALESALDCFLEAYSNENFPVYGMQKDSFTYLIGELNRRLNRSSEALKWYSTVITTIGASQRIKEMARDGKDKIKSTTTSA